MSSNLVQNPTTQYIAGLLAQGVSPGDAAYMTAQHFGQSTANWNTGSLTPGFQSGSSYGNLPSLPAYRPPTQSYSPPQVAAPVHHPLGGGVTSPTQAFSSVLKGMGLSTVAKMVGKLPTPTSAITPVIPSSSVTAKKYYPVYDAQGKPIPGAGQSVPDTSHIGGNIPISGVKPPTSTKYPTYPAPGGKKTDAQGREWYGGGSKPAGYYFKESAYVGGHVPGTTPVSHAYDTPKPVTSSQFTSVLKKSPLGIMMGGTALKTMGVGLSNIANKPQISLSGGTDLTPVQHGVNVAKSTPQSPLGAEVIKAGVTKTDTMGNVIPVSAPVVTGLGITDAAALALYNEAQAHPAGSIQRSGGEAAAFNAQNKVTPIHGTSEYRLQKYTNEQPEVNELVNRQFTDQEVYDAQQYLSQNNLIKTDESGNQHIDLVLANALDVPIETMYAAGYQGPGTDTNTGLGTAYHFSRIYSNYTDPASGNTNIEQMLSDYDKIGAPVVAQAAAMTLGYQPTLSRVAKEAVTVDGVTYGGNVDPGHVNPWTGQSAFKFEENFRVEDIGGPKGTFLRGSQKVGGWIESGLEHTVGRIPGIGSTLVGLGKGGVDFMTLNVTGIGQDYAQKGNAAFWTMAPFVGTTGVKTGLYWNEMSNWQRALGVGGSILAIAGGPILQGAGMLGKAGTSALRNVAGKASWSKNLWTGATNLTHAGTQIVKSPLYLVKGVADVAGKIPGVKTSTSAVGKGVSSVYDVLVKTPSQAITRGMAKHTPGVYNVAQGMSWAEGPKGTYMTRIAAKGPRVFGGPSGVVAKQAQYQMAKLGQKYGTVKVEGGSASGAVKIEKDIAGGPSKVTGLKTGSNEILDQRVIDNVKVGDKVELSDGTMGTVTSIEKGSPGYPVKKFAEIPDTRTGQTISHTYEEMVGRVEPSITVAKVGPSVWQRITGQVGELKSSVVGAVRGAGEKISGVADEAISGVKTVATESVKAVETGARTFGEYGAEQMTGLVRPSTTVRTAVGIGEDILGATKGGFSTIQDFLGTTKTGAVGLGQDMLSGMRATPGLVGGKVSEIYGGVKGFVETAPGRTVSATESIFGKVAEKVEPVVKAAGEVSETLGRSETGIKTGSIAETAEDAISYVNWKKWTGELDEEIGLFRKQFNADLDNYQGWENSLKTRDLHVPKEGSPSVVSNGARFAKTESYAKYLNDLHGDKQVLISRLQRELRDMEASGASKALIAEKQAILSKNLSEFTNLASRTRYANGMVKVAQKEFVDDLSNNITAESCGLKVGDLTLLKREGMPGYQILDMRNEWAEPWIKSQLTRDGKPIQIVDLSYLSRITGKNLGVIEDIFKKLIDKSELDDLVSRLTAKGSPPVGTQLEMFAEKVSLPKEFLQRVGKDIDQAVSGKITTDEFLRRSFARRQSGVTTMSPFETWMQSKFGNSEFMDAVAPRNLPVMSKTSGVYDAVVEAKIVGRFRENLKRGSEMNSVDDVISQIKRNIDDDLYFINNPVVKETPIIDVVAAKVRSGKLLSKSENNILNLNRDVVVNKIIDQNEALGLNLGSGLEIFPAKGAVRGGSNLRLKWKDEHPDIKSSVSQTRESILKEFENYSGIKVAAKKTSVIIEAPKASAVEARIKTSQKVLDDVTKNGRLEETNIVRNAENRDFVLRSYESTRDLSKAYNDLMDAASPKTGIVDPDNFLFRLKDYNAKLKDYQARAGTMQSEVGRAIGKYQSESSLAAGQRAFELQNINREMNVLRNIDRASNPEGYSIQLRKVADAAGIKISYGTLADQVPYGGIIHDLRGLPFKKTGDGGWIRVAGDGEMYSVTGSKGLSLRQDGTGKWRLSSKGDFVSGLSKDVIDELDSAMQRYGSLRSSGSAEELATARRSVDFALDKTIRDANVGDSASIMKIDSAHAFSDIIKGDYPQFKVSSKSVSGVEAISDAEATVLGKPYTGKGINADDALSQVDDMLKNPGVKSGLEAKSYDIEAGRVIRSQMEKNLEDFIIKKADDFTSELEAGVRQTSAEYIAELKSKGVVTGEVAKVLDDMKVYLDDEVRLIGSVDDELAKLGRLDRNSPEYAAQLENVKRAAGTLDGSESFRYVLENQKLIGDAPADICYNIKGGQYKNIEDLNALYEKLNNELGLVGGERIGSMRLSQSRRFKVVKGKGGGSSSQTIVPKSEPPGSSPYAIGKGPAEKPAVGRQIPGEKPASAPVESTPGVSGGAGGAGEIVPTRSGKQIVEEVRASQPREGFGIEPKLQAELKPVVKKPISTIEKVFTPASGAEIRPTSARQPMTIEESVTGIEVSRVGDTGIEAVVAPVGPAPGQLVMDLFGIKQEIRKPVTAEIVTPKVVPTESPAHVIKPIIAVPGQVSRIGVLENIVGKMPSNVENVFQVGSAIVVSSLKSQQQIIDQDVIVSPVPDVITIPEPNLITTPSITSWQDVFTKPINITDLVNITRPVNITKPVNVLKPIEEPYPYPKPYQPAPVSPAPPETPIVTPFETITPIETIYDYGYIQEPPPPPPPPPPIPWLFPSLPQLPSTGGVSTVEESALDRMFKPHKGFSMILPTMTYDTKALQSIFGQKLEKDYISKKEVVGTTRGHKTIHMKRPEGPAVAAVSRQNVKGKKVKSKKK